MTDYEDMQRAIWKSMQDHCTNLPDYDELMTAESTDEAQHVLGLLWDAESAWRQMITKMTELRDRLTTEISYAEQLRTGNSLGVVQGSGSLTDVYTAIANEKMHALVVACSRWSKQLEEEI